MTSAAPLLVEILTEELPPALVWRLADDFPNDLLTALCAAGFATQESPQAQREKLATPRRLIALLQNIRTASPPQTVFRRGPPLAVCYDKDGAPLPALTKFMHTVGATCDQELSRIKEKERDYIAWQGEQKGRQLADDLAAIVEKVLLHLNAPRLMRWGSNDYKFIRPVRGVMMMHGDTVIGGKIMGIVGGGETLRHRVLMAKSVKSVSPLSAAQYPQTMRNKGNVIVAIEERKENIRKQLWKAADDKNCKLNLRPGDGHDSEQADISYADEELLNEVAAMCENPKVYCGTMDAEFLSLPPFCVIGCIKKHQRYFPVYQRGKLSLDYDVLVDDNVPPPSVVVIDGTKYYQQYELSPHYLLVADNEPPRPAAMIDGFNAVLRARLRDVEFYLAEDRKLSGEDALDKLKNIVYHKKLGSQFARVERLRKIAANIAELIDLNHRVQKKTLDNAARLCKADLATQMINEYPEFEGEMAAEYFCQPDKDLVKLVRFHNCCYESDHQHDCRFLPSTSRSDDFAGIHDRGLALPAAALMLANHLEKLIGMFGIGEKPSGNKDPHGLRTAAAEVAAIIKGQAASMQTADLITAARRAFDDLPCADNIDENEIAAFIAERERHRILLIHQTISSGGSGGESPPIASRDNATRSILNAIFAHPSLLLADIEPKFNALNSFLRLPAAASLIAANKRISNIFRKSEVAATSLPPPDESLFAETAEHALHHTISTLQGKTAAFIAQKKFAEALESTATVATPVADFFAQVMVNAEDKKIRRNRFALLAQLQELLNSVADIAKLSG